MGTCRTRTYDLRVSIRDALYHPTELIVTLTVNTNLTTPLKPKSIKPIRLQSVPNNYTYIHIYILSKNITLLLAQSVLYSNFVTNPFGVFFLILWTENAPLNGNLHRVNFMGFNFVDIIELNFHFVIRLKFLKNRPQQYFARVEN
uniref:SFRICE_034336 n=1 Tax=Spodoptera frugiperda TaxID=7108 RepID=A0A2H1VIC3_SPOFR